MRALRPVHKMALPLGTGALSVLLFALGGVWSLLAVFLFFAFSLLLDKSSDHAPAPSEEAHPERSPKTNRTEGAT